MNTAKGRFCAALVGVCLAGGGLAGTGWGEDGPPLFGPHGVSPEAVHQGILGSCYFHASVAALAKAAPDTLRNDIRKSPDGGYQVHFFSGPDETVYPEDVQFGRAHSFDLSEGDWVLVLMRGYAQRALRQSLAATIQKSEFIPIFAKPIALNWLNQSGLLLVGYDRAIRTVINQDGTMDKAALKTTLAAQLSALGVPASEAGVLGGFLDDKGFFDQLAMTVEQNGEVFGAYRSLGQGGIPVGVFDAFVGGSKAGQVADRKPTMEQLRRVHAGEVALVGGTFAKAPDATLEGKDWWVSSHAYSVLDYDEAGQTVSLRNPWGTRPGPNGSFKLPLEVFLQGYESYWYSAPPAR